MPRQAKPAVTLAGLRKHIDKYGYDKTMKYSKGHNKKVPVDTVYKTYRKLRDDSAYQVARFYLEHDDYLELVGDYGGEKFISDAIAYEAWDKEETDDGADLRKRNSPAGDVRKPRRGQQTNPRQKSARRQPAGPR